MKNKYDMAIELLKLNKQNRILNLLQNSDIIDKDKIAEQVLNIDFKMLNKMFTSTQVRSINIENLLEPVKAIVENKLTIEEKNTFKNNGAKIVKNNKFAVVIMAGGQGSRLGFDGPKGTFSLELNGTKKFLFEIIIDRLKDAKKLYQELNLITEQEIAAREQDSDKKAKAAKEKETKMGLFGRQRLPEYLL